MEYKIKKGKHFANFTINRLWPFIFGNTVEGTFKFSKECWHSRDSINKTGWNKLLGVSGLLIHKNSGRLVWQPDFNIPGRILIATYVYDKGVRKIRKIASLLTEQEVNWSIYFADGMWTFTVCPEGDIVPGKIPALRFRAYPYFGGRSKAPNTMTINVNWE